MAGVEASLAAVPGLTIQRGEACESHLLDGVRATLPDVVIFELGAVSDKMMLSLFRELPAVHLIGLDLEQDRLLVVSGWQQSAPNTADLVRIIRDQASTPTPQEHT